MPRVLRRLPAALLVGVAAVLAGCGGAGSWQTADPQVTAGGLTLTVQRMQVDDAIEPWRQPSPGSHCVVYTVRVQATDGRRHDLRPDEFRSGSGTTLEALGRCNSAQLEPTWIGSDARSVQLTILETSDAPQPLQFSG